MEKDFWVDLAKGEYSLTTGWHCGAINGGTVMELRIRDRNFPLEELHIDDDYIRFVRPPEPIEDAKVRIRPPQSDDVNTRSRWPDNTVIVAIIGLVGVLATAGVTYLKNVSTSADPHPVAASSPLVESARSAAASAAPASKAAAASRSPASDALGTPRLRTSTQGMVSPSTSPVIHVKAVQGARGDPLNPTVAELGRIFPTGTASICTVYDDGAIFCRWQDQSSCMSSPYDLGGLEFPAASHFECRDAPQEAYCFGLVKRSRLAGPGDGRLPSCYVTASTCERQRLDDAAMATMVPQSMVVANACIDVTLGR